jgi:predicted phage baseplate assembly protein
MTLLLPNLDDRSWADLADEGRALIPVYGPEWTDHNASDPGITLVDLLAFVAEMNIFQLNQVSDRDRLKFLALVDVAPAPPAPSMAVLSVGAAPGAQPVMLPAGVEFAGNDPSAVETRFRTLDDVVVIPGSLSVLQKQDSAGFHNLTAAWQRGTAVAPFGPAPQIGTALYLGLSASPPVDTTVELTFTFVDGHSGSDERRRLIEDARALARFCRPPDNPCQCATATAASATTEAATPPSDSDSAGEETIPQHHGVRTVWEYAAAGGQWLPLDPSQGQVEDETRAFTLDGSVTVRLPGPIAPAAVGAVADTLYYVRCRLEAGRYDAAPLLRDIAFNGILVEQAVPAGMSFVIDPRATITLGAGGAPKPGSQTTLRMELDTQLRIAQLTFGGGNPADPEFLILDYVAPSGQKAGTLNIESVFLGFGDGFPDQQCTVPQAPVEYASFHLYTLENDTWLQWELKPDFDASKRTDLHAVLNATSGTLRFGNGEKGRVPPDIRRYGTTNKKCLVFAVCRTTRAAAGNLASGVITKLADSPHNCAILNDTVAAQGGWQKFKAQFGTVVNVLAASGGAAAETIDHAAGRADRSIAISGRAVTLADYESLALATPGTRIARVTAVANLHPGFPCFKAPGIVTVIVVPYLPACRPVPTPGLLRLVRSYLSRRRMIGTRIEVVGPTYLDVTVQASVTSLSGTNAGTLQQAIVAALNTFLDPLVGGPDGTGWPFGRSVYRAEIMRMIGEVSGVDYISSLDLIAGDSGPQCGNVCVGPTWLVAAGAHQITVT